MPVRATMKLALCAGAAMLLGQGAALAQLPPKSHHQPVPDADPGKWMVPAVRQWQAAGGSFALAPGARIVVPARAGAGIREVAAMLAGDLRTQSGLALPVVAGTARKGDIVLALGDAGLGSPSDEAYALAIADRVTLRGRGRSGLLYAGQTLLQMLRRDPAMRSLPRGTAQDWPDYPRRAQMVDIGRKYIEIPQLDALMREMAWLKLNTLGLHFTDWPAFRLRSDKFPGLADPLSYTRADVAHLEETARRYGITIIPEIDLPAHASALIGYKPSLAFDCPVMRRSDWLDRSAGDDAKNLAWTVDITKPENRAFLKQVVGEFLPWFKGPYFHIGGDEYQYDADKTRCPELTDYARSHGLQTAGDVFVDWINEMDGFVRAHGKRTAIWNWWRFKDDKTSIQPNKDILVYAWNSPRLQSIVDDGYDVLVTPEDKLYVVPGIENFDGGGYGLVDNEAIFDKMPLLKAPNVLGYMVALWNDAAEHRTDRYLIAKAYEPMAIMAERQWAGAASPSLDAFFARLNKAGGAPVPRD